MPVEDMVEYESWDLTDVALPPHSRLYHLDPIAFGTGSVESLTSYFSRLAEAHSVSAGALNHRVLLPLNAGRRNMFSCVVTARTRCFTSTINSIGHTAARFASVVGRLTGRTDLTHLTMLPWKPVLPTQLLTRGVAAWCPQCLNGWRKGGKTIHMPLLWALEVVKFCPDHRCTLQMVCTNCGKPQPLLGQCCPLGHCTRCKKWLGAEGPADRGARYSLLPSESPDWEVWAASQVKDLVRAGFDLPALLSRQQLSRLLWFATGAEGLGSFSRIVGVSPTSVTEWRSGQKLPMLPVYLRIARTLNVPLTDLLTGKVEPDSIPSLDVRQVPYWRSIRLHQKPSFDAGKAEQLLREALQESPPPSFLAFQKRTGYHYWTLHKHFPELCKLLRDRFQQHQAAVIAKRQQNKIAEFKNIAYQLHDQGIDLFVHRVLNRMSVPKSLNYRLARELLLEVKREILAREKETVQCFHARS